VTNGSIDNAARHLAPFPHVRQQQLVGLFVALESVFQHVPFQSHLIVAPPTHNHDG
jgi:hypothetical protein